MGSPYSSAHTPPYNPSEPAGSPPALHSMARSALPKAREAAADRTAAEDGLSRHLSSAEIAEPRQPPARSPTRSRQRKRSIALKSSFRKLQSYALCGVNLLASSCAAMTFANLWAAGPPGMEMARHSLRPSSPAPARPARKQPQKQAGRQRPCMSP